MRPEKKKSVLYPIGTVLLGIFVFVVSLIGFAAVWCFNTWGDLDMDEIIFQLQSPLQGAGNGMIGDYLLKGLLPVIVILVAYIIFAIVIKSKIGRRIFVLTVLVLLIAGGITIQQMTWKRLDMGQWLKGQFSGSAFIEENYVDPKTTSIRFPEKKRNLIYIYLESMEVSYTDPEAGGAFPENLIPELTDIALREEDFSGNSGVLNGGVVYPGTGFTTGALFAQSAGLPLKVSIGGNSMEAQSSFFSNIETMGDILEKEGYRQCFLIGSDATFGGRRQLYKDHGDFEIRDYLYAKEQGWIEPDYEVFWGYEDEKLFSFAKETLKEFAEGEEPFNLTILTVDTHFEDGYICRLCDDKFGDNQYANVMACSSRQVSDFVDWICQQDFYENTTVILSGDHTTMDKDFCLDLSPDYLRKTYTAILNADAVNQQPEKEREYSTMDMFPTTLAALGAEIDGERLGLGTNLFSGKETLTEEYGAYWLKKELVKRSEFLEKMEQVEEMSEGDLIALLRVYLKDSLKVEQYDEKTGTIDIRIVDDTLLNNNFDESLTLDLKRIEAEFQEDGSDRIDKIILGSEKKDGLLEFYGRLDISSWKTKHGQLRINIILKDGTVFENVMSEYISEFLPGKSDFIRYFELLKEHPEYSVLLGIKDEGTNALTEEMQDAMLALGLKTKLIGQFRTSYLAVIDAGKVYEEAGYEKLTADGVFQDTRTVYYVESAGYDSGQSVSIQIGGKEYAKDRTGINIVVYDPVSDSVIDSSFFNTYEGS